VKFTFAMAAATPTCDHKTFWGSGGRSRMQKDHPQCR